MWSMTTRTAAACRRSERWEWNMAAGAVTGRTRTGGLQGVARLGFGMGRRGCGQDGSPGAQVAGLGRQPLDPPAVAPALPHVADSVVQAALAALPELDRVRDDPVAPPMRRQGDVAAGEPGLDLPHVAFQRGAARDDPALVRGPRAEAAAERPGLEVAL